MSDGNFMYHMLFEMLPMNGSLCCGNMRPRLLSLYCCQYLVGKYYYYLHGITFVITHGLTLVRHFQPVISANEYLCLKLARATNTN